MNRYKTIAIFILLSFLAVTLGGTNLTANAKTLASPAQESETTKTPQMCFALDVVFVIDQSGSMTGKTPNDPLGQRFNAPRYALDWLANNRLGMCPDTVHRIGVVSFGSDAVIDLPLTRIEPMDQDHWNKIRPGLESQIQEHDMNATHPILGFLKAKEILDGAPPLANEFRKRAIVFLTDGQPCVPGVGCSLDRDDPVNKAYIEKFLMQIRTDFHFSERLRKTDEALRQVMLTYGSLVDTPEGEINKIFADNEITAEDLFGSTYLYIIAMNSNEPYLETVGDSFRDITTEYGGELIDLEQNLNEVPRQFNQILSWLSGVTPVITGCGSLPVDPYLSGAILDVFKSAQGLEVEIQFEGKALKAGQGDSEFFGMAQYSEYGAVEHYRFNQPPAGLWNIFCAANDDDIKAAFIPFKATVTQIEPAEVVPQYNVGDAISDPGFPYYLKYRIIDRENHLTLDLNEEYPISMKATITDPSGGVSVLDMEFQGEGNWSSVQPIPVNLLGDYQIEMVGTAPCVDDPTRPNRCPDSTFEVFHDSEGKYSTAAVDIFNIVVQTPQDGDKLALHGKLLPDKLAPQPLSVRLQIQDQSGNPLSYDQVISGNPDEAFVVTITAGAQVIPMALQVDENDPSTFIGQSMEPFIKGDQEIRVELPAGHYQHEKYRPYNTPVTIKFSRGDPLFQNPIFYRVMSWILALVLLVVVIRVVICRMNPVRGSISAMKGGQSVTIPVYTGSCKVVLNASRTPGVRTIGLQRMVITNLGAQGRARRIRVICQGAKGKREIALSDAEYGAIAPVTVNEWSLVYKSGLPAKPATPRITRPRPGARGR